MKAHQVTPVNPNRLAKAIPTINVTKTGSKINNIIISIIPVIPAISNNLNIDYNLFVKGYEEIKF